MTKNDKSWLIYLRLITPVMIFVVGIYTTMIGNDIKLVREEIRKIDERIFMHLTNEEIHTPRSYVVSQQSFVLYQTMRDRQMDEVKDSMRRIESILQKQYKLK